MRQNVRSWNMIRFDANGSCSGPHRASSPPVGAAPGTPAIRVHARTADTAVARHETYGRHEPCYDCVLALIAMGEVMRAAYYERNGPAAEVLRVGDVDAPQPGPGEVRVKVRTSGVNPSDVKSRAGLTRKIAFARVIPHSDGAGEIEMVGAGVSASRIGERVWTWNAQWKRPFGTAAEYVVLPEAQAVPL